MAQPHKMGGRVGTWPQPGAGGAAGAAGAEAPWLAPLPELAGALADRVRQWVAAELAPGRLTPWLPVAFGAGVIVYFTAEREPVWWVAAALAAAAMAVAYGLRTRPVAFPVALGCAAIAAGLATGAIKAHLYDHAVLQRSAYGVSVTGFVETHEEREKSDRIVLRVTSIDGPRLTEHPERIRLTLRKGTAPPVGAHVAFKARLNPPASPFRPSGYDLARDLYFRGIGATGLALGAIRMEAPPVEPDWRLQFAIGIEQIRDASMPASAPRSRATPGRSHPRSSPARKTRSAATCSRLASCPDVIPSCPDRASEVAIP